MIFTSLHFTTLFLDIKRCLKNRDVGTNRIESSGGNLTHTVTSYLVRWNMGSFTSMCAWANHSCSRRIRLHLGGSLNHVSVMRS